MYCQQSYHSLTQCHKLPVITSFPQPGLANCRRNNILNAVCVCVSKTAECTTFLNAAGKNCNAMSGAISIFLQRSVATQGAEKCRKTKFLNAVRQNCRMQNFLNAVCVKLQNVSFFNTQLEKNCHWAALSPTFCTAVWQRRVPKNGRKHKFQTKALYS